MFISLSNDYFFSNVFGIYMFKYLDGVYNKALLCYNIWWSLLSSQFMSSLYPICVLYSGIPWFLRQCIFFVFHCDDNISGPFPVDCLWTVPNDILRVMRRWGGRAGARWWRGNFSSVRTKLFWNDIYCAKLRPDTKSQSGYRSLRGLGRRALHIMWE